MSGKVTDLSGAPLAKAEVAASSGVKTQTYSDGTFALKITHPGQFTLTLTVTKASYKPYTTPSTSVARNPLTLTPVQLAPESGAESGSGGDSDPGAEPEGRSRFTLEQNPGTEASPTYTLSITEGVKTITQGEFAADPSAIGSITSNTRLAGQLGTNPRSRVTAIELPDTLRTIGNHALRNHSGFTGELAIPAAVESIGQGAFDSLGRDNRQVRLRFAQDSRLKTIGIAAFATAQISAMPPLPQSLETVGLRAFDGAFTPAAGPSLSNFVIPQNVRSLEKWAFAGAAFSGTLTIESPHVTRTPPLDPPNTPGAKTGKLGDNLFAVGRAAANQLTTIYLPKTVFDSYTQADLDVIFGTFAKPEGKYVDIADKTTELTK